MWKDFFYFSKGERRAIVLLLALIVIIMGGLFWAPSTMEGKVESGKQGSFAEMEQFLAGVHEIERKRSALYASKGKKKRTILLAPFDPNLADSIELLDLGLPPFIAHNILKYRKAGGKFSTPEAFSRIYGVTEEQFNMLKPYIFISEAFQKKKQDTLKFAAAQRDTLRVYKYPEGTLVDMNSADTTELKKIPGVGSAIAGMIVEYRKKLGGFYDLSQLSEIKYVTPDILKWCKVENASIHRINANKVGLDKLRSHPYINFYQAKVIVEYRRKRGKLKSLSQLALYEEFTEKDLERLSHYLIFD